MPRAAFGMGKLSAAQIGGVTWLSGMGKYIVGRAGYMVSTFARRLLTIVNGGG